MKKVKWGIVSTANIAQQWLIPAMHASEYAEVVAVGSRDLAKAQTFANSNNIPTAYGSYEELLADPNVDAIYNPLPNNLHVPISMQAIEAGKHVLCEKPLGMDVADIMPLIELAEKHPELVVMEAFMYRFHPQWKKIKAMVDGGELGQINAVEANFSYFNRDPDNVRHKPNVGGGGLLDIGCYCISAARYIFGREPKRVVGMLDIDPDFQVDRHASGILDFAPGMATFIISTQSNSSHHLKIFGDKATMVVENPFYKRDVPSRLLVRRDNEDEVIEVGTSEHYTDQINAFSMAVLEGSPAPTPLSDALANMKVIDSIFASSKTSSWV